MEEDKGCLQADCDGKATVCLDCVYKCMIKERLDFYSVISQLLNELEDDLQLDLDDGDSGYGTYKESYQAVRKHTLRVLKKHEKRMRLQKIKDGNCTLSETEEKN